MKRSRQSSLLLFINTLMLLSIIVDYKNARAFNNQRNESSLFKYIKNQRHLHRSRNNHRLPRQNSLTVCDTCRMNRYDTPFYCPIEPNIPQCIFPVCPKICDDTGGDPSVRLKFIPPSPPKRAPFPYPVNLPRIPKNLINEFTPDSPPPPTPIAQGRSMRVSLQTENIAPYNTKTCEFPTPNLRRLRPGSKYIEYRPSKLNYQVSDILRIASEYGLVPAEFRHPMEWYSVEKSSLAETVSTYKMTEQQPRYFYAVGLSDDNGATENLGKFLYKSDNTSATFAVFDPRVYGRIDERCGVLSYVLGSDKRQYLTTRFWNCDKYMGDDNRVAHGLFMFPPGSLCYTRSEEECARLQQEKAGGDAVYHNTIQIGQTLTRFIYLYTDQRSWEDAFSLCKAKGMHMLDLDSKWSDALRVAEVIEHFLREAKLNPVTSFWTSGRFGTAYSDGRFTWATTDAVFENLYIEEAPPFAYSWWDDQQAVTPAEIILSRRRAMNQPCVSIAVNPETGGERPKLNFKAWYCDFPMYVLCYQNLNDTNTMFKPTPRATTSIRPPPKQDSCEKLSAAITETVQKEIIDPFDQFTCTSKSLTVKRLTPNSKFVDYQPQELSYSVEQIKEQCVKYGLLPAEIRSREDWEAIEKSGIGGVIAGNGRNNADYFYAIGMDDSKEAGKMRYQSNNEELTFSMFSAEGTSYKDDRCSMLSSVDASGGESSGLTMLHVSCKEGLQSDEKIAYGLCMFPPSSKCFKESTEETAAASDMSKFTTIIPLGITDTRSIFFNPVQRDWEDAWNFSQAANLSLLDFDPKWGDSLQVMTIIKEKLVKDGGFFQLTPFWSSGKLSGSYKGGAGKWESTKETLLVTDNQIYKWARLNHPHLSKLREGSMENACVEATFQFTKSAVSHSIQYCDMPNYFLMYRFSTGQYALNSRGFTTVSKRRQDPLGINTLGITVIETGPRVAVSKQGINSKRTNKAPSSLLVKTTAKKTEKNDTAMLNEGIRQTRNAMISNKVDVDVRNVDFPEDFNAMADSQEDSDSSNGNDSSSTSTSSSRNVDEESDDNLLAPMRKSTPTPTVKGAKLPGDDDSEESEEEEESEVEEDSEDNVSE